MATERLHPESCVLVWSPDLQAGIFAIKDRTWNIHDTDSCNDGLSKLYLIQSQDTPFLESQFYCHILEYSDHFLEPLQLNFPDYSKGQLGVI